MNIITAIRGKQLLFPLQVLAMKRFRISMLSSGHYPRFNDAAGELVMSAENLRRIPLSEALVKRDYGQLLPNGFPVPYNSEEVLHTCVEQELESVLLLNPGMYHPRTVQGLLRGATRTEQFSHLAKAERLQKAVE